MFVNIIQDFEFNNRPYTVGMNPNVPRDLGLTWIAEGKAELDARPGKQRRPLYVADEADTVTPTSSMVVPVYDRSESVGDSVRLVDLSPNDGAVVVETTDSASTIASKIATLLPEVAVDSPLARGRTVKLKAAEYVTGACAISTMQSLVGVKGSTQLTYSPSASPIAPSPGDYGHLTLLDDSKAKKFIRGNGVIRDLDLQGDRMAWEDANPGLVVTGYWAPDRSSGKCIAHTMDNVAAYNYTGDGFYIGEGNDQLVANRLRAENNVGWGVVLKSSDIKGQNWGIQSLTGALLIDNCAPELSTIDLFLPDDAECEGTLHIIDSTRAQIKGGTVEGRTIIRGRNDGGAASRFENTGIVLSHLVFKHDQRLNDTRYYSGVDQIYVYDSYIEVEDTDGVKIIAPRFGFDSDLTGAELPDWLIKISTTSGNDQRLGHVFLSQTSAMLDPMGRIGGSRAQRIGVKKHWSNQPRLVMFDWGIPGQPVVVPDWACDTTKPWLITHLKCDGATYNKADYPFGYLCATLHLSTPGTLDDVNTTFTTPSATGLPSLPSGYSWAIRVVP